MVPREDDRSADWVGHPLLASLGRDTRELRRLLADVPSSATAVDVAEPDTLLGWLQHDLRANHAPTVEERAGRSLRDDDRSLQVHACHSAARQVDVLREVLVGLLDDDRDLEPRDILVMCPDIETFAPLISAGFGLADVVEDADGGGHPAHRLRVRLADRALSSTNPLLAVAATLVELAGGRVTASDVLDLATQEACRLRFGFSDDDLARVTRWVAQAGIRWGIDGPSRAPFEMARFDHNTWRSAAGHLPGGRQDEGVLPGMAALTARNTRVVQPDELAELGEVAADQGEVVRARRAGGSRRIRSSPDRLPSWQPRAKQESVG